MTGRLGAAGHELMDKGQEMIELVAALKAAKQQSIIDALPSQGVELLDIMANRPTLFAEKISFHYGAQPQFYNLPVLATIDLQAFTENFLKLSPAGQKDVTTALHDRASEMSTPGVVEAESSWMAGFRERLATFADGQTGLEQFRLRQLIDWHLATNVVSEDPEKLT